MNRDIVNTASTHQEGAYNNEGNVPKYHVTRSIEIEAAREEIQQILCDFRQWPIWSPWLGMEPETQLKFNDKQGDVGAQYSWRGEMTGQGNMTIASIEPEKVVMNLQFVKPFKSKAQVVFSLVRTNETTQLAWNMHSKIPFFLAFMTKKLRAIIGMDYERGLKMLKEYVEQGSVSSSVTIDPDSEIAPTHYLGIADDANLTQLGEIMPSHYAKIAAYMKDNDIEPLGAAMAIYTSVNVATSQTSFISSFAVDEATKNRTHDGFVTGTVSASKAVKVLHKGSWFHLGNAWATAISYARANKLKASKDISGIELYLDSPEETPKEKLRTEIYLPLR